MADIAEIISENLRMIGEVLMISFNHESIGRL